MRIDDVTVSNFRGFHEPRKIPMPGNVVIIRGPNGSGKTSFLDAIQWLLLGDVPRLCSGILKRDEDYLTNRYASGPPFVEANLLVDDQRRVRVSRRGLGKSMQIQVDRPGEPGLVGEEAQHWLRTVMSPGLSGLQEIDFLRRYLLQQDDMREFLGADTKERYQFIATLSGMERLTGLEEQMKEELKVARKNVKDLKESRAKAAAELEAARGSVLAAGEVTAGREVDPGASEATARARSLLGLSDQDEPLAALRERSGAIAEALERIIGLGQREARAREALNELPVDKAEQSAELAAKVAELIAAEEQATSELAQMDAALTEARTAADHAQQLAALALEQIDGPCPVCEQEHDIEKTQAHLREMLEGAPGLGDLSAAVEAKRGECAELRSQRAAVEADATRLRAAAEGRREREDQLAQAGELAQSSRQALLALLPDQAAAKGDPTGAAEALRRELDELAARLQRVADSEARVRQAQKRVDSLDQQRQLSESRHAELGAALAAAEKRVERAKEARTALGLKVTDVMREVANSSTGLINAIYTRLDVHPTFREFGFHTQRYQEVGHLRPWVYDRRRKKEGNALHVLSAAQLNSLAICLFLALNLERDAELRTAILDDPVQSLDDVNLLSLADVLRTVRGRRQVIVSTHDDTLAELLIRKLRPLEDSDATAVITIDQWGEAGPRVTPEMRSSSGMEPEFQLLADVSA